MIHTFQKTMKTEDSVFNTFLKWILVEQQLYSGTINSYIEGAEEEEDCLLSSVSKKIEIKRLRYFYPNVVFCICHTKVDQMSVKVIIFHQM